MKRFWGIFFAFLVVLGAFPLTARAAPAEVAAKSALLMEISTGKILYEQNAHQPLAPASVTKVMTMLLIMEAIDQERIRWNDTVTASENAAAKGGSQIYLKVWVVEMPCTRKIPSKMVRIRWSLSTQYNLSIALYVPVIK